MSTTSDTPNERYTWELLKQVKVLASVMDLEDDLVSEYFDVPSRQALTEDELDNLQVTQAQVGSCITLLQNLHKFLHNDTPTQGDYAVNINAVRRSAG